MSSILTNNGAMVALQTLKSINSDLSTVQSQIATGKTVGSAKDNAAIWAISKVMESDVRGFKGISDSLSLGQSTVALARQGAETVTELLTQMKEKIVAAQGSNVDRAKIQTDVTALRNQIESVVSAAQFNGLNLLQNTDSTLPGSINVLSSLDRSGTGVAASDINVGKVDLSSSKATFTVVSGTTAMATTLPSNVVTMNNSTTNGTVTMSGTIEAGKIYTLNVNVADGLTALTDIRSDSATNGITLAGAQKYTYVTKAGDTAADITKNLADQFNKAKTESGVAANALQITANSNGTLSVAATGTTAANTIGISIGEITGAENIKAAGGLADLSDYDLTTEAGVDSALESIEGMIQKAVDAAAAFGSAEKRIGIQSEFISSLTDSLKAGIGTLTDTNMEEASARLQALQVQQQLGIQALSIANQAPQSLLSLFRG